MARFLLAEINIAISVNAAAEELAMQTVLITGGAGFIGSHLADELLAAGYRVRALDSLEPQVHGADRRRPEYLDERVELQVGDVRDPAAVATALQGVSGVVHLAARVGVGQSMYEMASYTDTNVRGTAVLLEQLSGSDVESLVVASSMSVYGEGLYRDARGQRVEAERDPQRVREGRWDITGDDGLPLTPVPTPESKRPHLASIYALTKMDQERMCLIYGEAYGLRTVALRFFNAYGERQALSNPYTGVLAIFGSRLLNGRPPLIFEDGNQRRDFVHVSDVARACRLALETPQAAGQAFNVGSGESISIAELAGRTAKVMGSDIEARITGEFRTGDIRHCFADIDAARRVLGFQPRVGLEEGLDRLAPWLARQTAVDRVEQAREELLARRLAI
jgi:dTDP-L-rhamnose 4-epimerase